MEQSGPILGSFGNGSLMRALKRYRFKVIIGATVEQLATSVLTRFTIIFVAAVPLPLLFACCR